MATTINAYSVGLHLDASSYIRNSSLSRKETASLSRSINQARTPADNYRRRLDLLDKSLAAGAIQQRTYNKLLADAKTRFGGTATTAGKYGQTLKSQVATVGRLAAAYVGFSAAFNQVKSGLSDSAAAESMGVQFEVLTGNAERAASLMQQLRQFSAATPFQFGDIAQAGRQLLAFGFESQSVIENVQVLGNIAAGTGNSMSELAELVGKARVQGRLFNEDINQLTGRGINVIDGLAAKFGDVKQAAADGKISFSDLQSVLKGLATDGGQFAGMMERMSETTSGKISTLTDNFKQLRMEITGNLIPALNTALDKTGPWLKKFSAGIDFLTTGGKNTYDNIAARERSEAMEIAFMRNQLANKEKIRASRALGLGDGTADNAFQINPSSIADGLKGAGGSLFAGLQGAATQLGFAAQSQFNVHQNQVRAIQRQEQLEREKTTKPNPAIKSLEVGTQEAYKFLTQNQNKVESETKRENKRKAKHGEEVSENWGKNLTFLETLANWAQENGFQPIR